MKRTEQKSKNKIAATILGLAMPLMMLGGCGGNMDSQDNSAGNLGAGEESRPEGETDLEATAMGRYVEEATDLSWRISGYGSGISELEDGSLVISDIETYFLSSADGAATWDTDNREWRTRMLAENFYIIDIAVGADNTAAVLYDAIRSGKSQDEEVEESGGSDAFTWEPKLIVIKPDGTQISTEIFIEEDDRQADKVFVSDTGRVFATTYGANIYEVKEDGSSEKYLTMENRPWLIQFQGNFMVIDGANYKGPYIYDMERQEYLDDEVLVNFVEENYKGRTDNGGSFYDLYFFFGEENVLYLAGDKGLHRHVIGGSAIEQVIDGSLSSFNNPSYGIKGMVALDNSEFVVLFTQGRLIKFVYNPDIPTVPEERIKVYSLRNNNTLRQAVTSYQALYPEVYVEYEIGIEEGSAATREDAIKKLNTKIMAGEGPDVLVMDNLPFDSYIGKGMLLDISPILDSLSGEDALYENIVDAFRSGDKIYAVPCEIGLPVISAKESELSEVRNLSGVADTAENVRKNNPGKDVLGICSEKGVLKMFSMISAPYWKTDTGEIDREAVADYFTQAKRIYDAQMDGLPEKEIQEYMEWNQDLTEIYGMDYEDSGYARIGMEYMNYVIGERQMTCGALVGEYEYAALLSCAKMEGYEGSKTVLMDKDIFYPQTITAINAATDNEEQAEAFLRLLLGKEAQSSLFLGLPVNKEGFNQIRMEETEAGELYSTISMMDDDGNAIDLYIYWPDEEQLTEFEKWAETVSVPYIEDDTFEKIVIEEGIKYLQGVQSIEDALEAVEKKAALYMAE